MCDTDKLINRLWLALPKHQVDKVMREISTKERRILADVLLAYVLNPNEEEQRDVVLVNGPTDHR